MGEVAELVSASSRRCAAVLLFKADQVCVCVCIDLGKEEVDDTHRTQEYMGHHLPHLTRPEN